ncbi:MAG: hypothetical protein KIT14_00330 [bacterium]|nr:hypothetical protein [bacterium]
MRTWARVLLGCVVGTLLGTLFPAESRAYFLDAGRNFDVRVRAYSQLGILTENSERKGCQPVYTTVNGKRGPVLFQNDPRTCPPKYSAGTLAQHRNFYNPEFDAKLTPYLNWMGDVQGLSWVAPDDFKFRFAWWGFYDGIYDYLDPLWDSNRRSLRGRLSQSDDPGVESAKFQDENKNPRHILASRNRINELYVDYTKGPVFFRIGRQAISWGEADTIALLDVSNPFELVNGAPGLFTDVDEARIPLWTARGTFKLLDNWEWLSSLFLDTYLVPGPIDTTVPTTPLVGGITPFGPDQGDPQWNLVIGPTRRQVADQNTQLHTVVVDKLPKNNWGNSRWGARLTSIIARDYTVQGWFFRTFNQQPVPVLQNLAAPRLYGDKIRYQVDNRGFRTPLCLNRVNGIGRTPAGRRCFNKTPVVTTLEHRLESVIGLAGTWFSPTVNGIIRTEAEIFIDEPAFIPTRQLNPRTQIPAALRRSPLLNDNKKYFNTMQKADYIRWVIGYDRFFFFRPINPSSSIVLSAAFNNSFNLSEKGGKDYRYPQTKPGYFLQAQSGVIPRIAACAPKTGARNNPLCVRAVPRNFEDAYQYEGFFQFALQTDMFHGKFSPRLTFIADVSGIFVFQPTGTYRINDNVLLTATWVGIEASRKAGPGTFRAHDMLQLRVTFQLN